MMVYFLFQEPVNQIFLSRTSKEDIVRRVYSYSEDQALKMLQSVLKLITKVEFIVFTNSTFMFDSTIHRWIQAYANTDGEV